MDVFGLFLIIIMVVVFSMLGTIQRERFIKRVRNELEDEDWRVRVKVVMRLNEFLKEFTNDQIVHLLLKAFSDENWSVRVEAVKVVEQKINAYTSSENDRKPVVSPSMKPVVVDHLIKALEDEHPSIRRHAAEALGKADDPWGVTHLIRALGDKDRDVRKSVIMALGDRSDLRAIKPLLRLIKDEIFALLALEKLCALVHIVVFGQNGFENLDQDHALIDPDVSELTVLMPALKEVIIHTETCDIHQVEAFTNYMLAYIDEGYLRKHVTVHIHGNFGKSRLSIYNPFTMCKRVKVDVDVIIFGDEASQEYTPHKTLQNPDFSECTLPLLQMKQVVIHTTTYDFFQVECFLTYAMNYVGQQYLKKHVDVDLYGDPEKLHPNLRNSLTNLCKCLHVHDHGDRF